MCWEIYSHVAGVAYWWEGYYHVDFLGARFSEGVDDVPAAGTPDDAVVNYDDISSLDDRLYDDHFPDYFFSALVSGFDEAAKAAFASVPVLHQSLFHGYSAFLRVA